MSAPSLEDAVNRYPVTLFPHTALAARHADKWLGILEQGMKTNSNSAGWETMLNFTDIHVDSLEEKILMGALWMCQATGPTKGMEVSWTILKKSDQSVITAVLLCAKKKKIDKVTTD